MTGIQFVSFGAEWSNSSNPGKNTITILIPPTGEEAYKIAGESFADMWEKVSGHRPVIMQIEPENIELPKGDIILIGSDAVNPVTHNLVRSGLLESLEIQYGADNYRMLSLQENRRTILVLAGGCGRSTIYAVYDFFRKQAGVEYFWDQDVIPPHDQIQITEIDILEQPRFEYRGLRYFAHRSLHRFQAEHWDLDDWQKEIDWMMKKRFNLFMLRTGIDDLFQRAFPDDVTYPPIDTQDPDAEQRSYNDRTTFWQLRYRGELRKQVLQYARDRGLLHPEDVGTITHWYSHTPSSFYQSNPNFPVVMNQKSGYSLPTQAIWDIESQKAWDAYWKLTETHIHEFGGGYPRLFHTIGMAERTFGNTYRDNLQSKLFVYRKTQQMCREHYPDVPLLIASWDFIGWKWKDEGVQELLKEFDSKRTILLDYTADLYDRVTYHDWDVYKKFPWIFGIFHSLEKNNDIHEDYNNILTPRLKEAVDDDQCIGLVLWSENSHSDTYLLEYLGYNSWQPQHLEIEKATAHFCDTRYPVEIVPQMNHVWSSFLPLSQCLHFVLGGKTGCQLLFWEPQFRVLTTNYLADLTPELVSKYEADYRLLYPALKQAPIALRGLYALADKSFDNLLWRRDALDITRTIISRALFASIAKGVCLMEDWRQQKADTADIYQLAELSQDLLGSLSEILAMSDDFSMYASLERLSCAEEINGIQPIINPHAEQTLKANAENNYCRTHQYELVEYVYRAELAAYWNWVLNRIKSGDRAPWNMPPELKKQGKIIVDQFYETPLKSMSPTISRNPEKLSEIILQIEKLVIRLLDESGDC